MSTFIELTDEEGDPIFVRRSEIASITQTNEKMTWLNLTGGHGILVEEEPKSIVLALEYGGEVKRR